MEEPKSPRPLERLAKLRADQVEEERRKLEIAQAVLSARRAERDEAKAKQREAEKRASSFAMRGMGEGATAALEALVIGHKRLEDTRARVRTAKQAVAACEQRLELERAHERAAREMAGDRARAVQRWREGKEQEQIEEGFRVRQRDET